MVSLKECHRCRAEPFEATIYSLEAAGKALEIFKANFQAELTIEVEESAAEESQETKRASYLELPLNFSREDAVKVEHSSLAKSPFTPSVCINAAATLRYR